MTINSLNSRRYINKCTHKPFPACKVPSYPNNNSSYRTNYGSDLQQISVSLLAERALLDLYYGNESLNSWDVDRFQNLRNKAHHRATVPGFASTQNPLNWESSCHVLNAIWNFVDNSWSSWRVFGWQDCGTIPCQNRHFLAERFCQSLKWSAALETSLHELFFYPGDKQLQGNEASFTNPPYKPHRRFY